LTRKLVILFILLGIFYQYNVAQDNIPIGTWRTHLSFNNVLDVTGGDTEIYASTINSIFSLDLIDNSINKITSLDGLSDNSISTINYSTENLVLIVAYTNGNVDIIKDNQIINFPLIKEAKISGTKRINHILFRFQLAYLSTDFGVVVLDLDKLEIKVTFRDIGINGTTLKIYGSVILNDSLFLSTESGIIAGSLDQNINLQDFNNWKRFNTIDGISATSSKAITANGSNIYAGVDGDGIFKFANGIWTKLNFLLGEIFLSISVNSNNLIVVTLNGLWEIRDEQSINPVIDNLINKPNKAIFFNSKICIADNKNGLITNSNGVFQNFFPTGPFSNNSFKIKLLGNRIYVVPGGYDENFNPLNREEGFFVFVDGQWISYNGFNQVSNIPFEIRDLVDVASILPTQITYFASFGYGILKWDMSGGFSIIDENNSPLENSNAPERFTQITSLAHDQSGLWVANHNATNPLHILKPDNTWESFSFGLAAARFPLQIELSQSGNKWIRLNPDNGGGIIVFDEQTGQSKYLTTENGMGGLPSNTINEIAIDHNDQAWIATDKGVAFFSNASTVLTDDQVNAILPIFEQNILLFNQNITSIEVDGGNRKWIGTNKGVWLFDEDGEKLFYNFNLENSPIISDMITDIEINHKTGEVFFATDLGIISYRSTSSEGTDTHSNVIIFPNPVTQDFNGKVGFSGLPNNAVVKITDTSGKLIWQTKSFGGTATWDVLDYKGKRPSTGIYLVFSSTTDGNDTFVGKIAVIN